MRRKPSRAVLILFLAMSLSIGWAQSSPSLRQRIPKSDPAKYRAVRDARDWKNPILIVQPNGVEIIGVNGGRAIKVDSVEKALEALPTSAWPYGLVVAVQDAGIVLKSQAFRIPPNRAKLLTVLKRLDVATVLWPSN